MQDESAAKGDRQVDWNCDVKDGFEVVKAEATHIPGMANLFDVYQITPEDWPNRLDVNHPECFTKTGGIFERLENSFLEHMICSDEREDYDVLVAVSNEADEVVGFAEYRLQGKRIFHDEFDVVLTDHSKSLAQEYARFKRSLEKEKVVFWGHMIIAPAWKTKGIWDEILRREWTKLRELGYTHAFGQTYTIVDGEIELPNVSRGICVGKFNSQVIGYVTKELSVGDAAVHIKADVHIFNI